MGTLFRMKNGQTSAALLTKQWKSAADVSWRDLFISGVQHDSKPTFQKEPRGYSNQVLDCGGPPPHSDAGKLQTQ
jgi:hypothetical protein